MPLLDEIYFWSRLAAVFAMGVTGYKSLTSSSTAIKGYQKNQFDAFSWLWIASDGIDISYDPVLKLTQFCEDFKASESVAERPMLCLLPTVLLYNLVKCLRVSRRICGLSYLIFINYHDFVESILWCLLVLRYIGEIRNYLRGLNVVVADHFDRDAVLHASDTDREVAALKIQTKYRQYTAKKVVREMREENAAVKIQACFRGHLDRKRVHSIKHAAEHEETEAKEMARVEEEEMKGDSPSKIMVADFPDKRSELEETAMEQASAQLEKEANKEQQKKDEKEMTETKEGKVEEGKEDEQGALSLNRKFTPTSKLRMFVASTSDSVKQKTARSDKGPVVLVENINQSRVTTIALFTLFDVYGDVIRVKICCSTKSKALIQYKDYKYARDAIMNLDGLSLWGRQLKLTISKDRIILMPNEGAHNANLTIDYTTSRHRFHNGDRSQAPVVAPSKTLFLANIPPKVTETKLKRMFNACGTVVDFKFFEPSNLFRLQQAVQISQLPPNSDRSKERFLSSTPDQRMALIQLSTVEEGVDALMNLHNKQFPGTNRYLCVSFTTSVIEHHVVGQ